MNHFFRLLLLIFFARRRGTCHLLGPCHTPFMVLPTDLDVLGHVNNGVYLSMLDLARLDLLIRSGLMPKLRGEGWYGVVAAETIQVRKSLRLFEKFMVETRVLGWDEKAALIFHQFIRRDVVVATAVVRIRFLRRAGGTVTTAELLRLAGLQQESPELPAWVQRWNDDQQEVLAVRS